MTECWSPRPGRRWSTSEELWWCSAPPFLQLVFTTCYGQFPIYCFQQPCGAAKCKKGSVLTQSLSASWKQLRKTFFILIIFVLKWWTSWNGRPLGGFGRLDCCWCFFAKNEKCFLPHIQYNVMLLNVTLTEILTVCVLFVSQLGLPESNVRQETV